MAVERDAQHVALHPAVEALNHAVGLGRIGVRLAMLHTVPLAGSLEGIGREAGAAVGQNMGDLERKGTERIRQEGSGGRRGLVVFDGEVHVAGDAVNGDVQVALTQDAVAILQFEQVFDVNVDEADLVLLEGTVQFASLLGGQAVEPLRLEDAIDRIPVQVRQEMADEEGQCFEREAGAAPERIHEGALLVTGAPGQLMGSSRTILAIIRAMLTPLADGLGGDAIAHGECARTLERTGDLSTGGRGGPRLGMDGKHQLARLPARRRTCSKRHAQTSIA